MAILASVLVTVMATAPAGVTRTEVAAILALGVGLFYLAAWALRLGVIANFLSRPILTGFFTGISLSILVGQIDRVTGADIEFNGLIRPVVELLQEAGSIHWPSSALALGMFALLQVVRIVRFPVPGPVVVLVLSVILSAAFNFKDSASPWSATSRQICPRWTCRDLPAFRFKPWPSAPRRSFS